MCATRITITRTIWISTPGSTIITMLWLLIDVQVQDSSESINITLHAFASPVEQSGLGARGSSARNIEGKISSELINGVQLVSTYFNFGKFNSGAILRKWRQSMWDRDTQLEEELLERERDLYSISCVLELLVSISTFIAAYFMPSKFDPSCPSWCRTTSRPVWRAQEIREISLPFPHTKFRWRRRMHFKLGAHMVVYFILLSHVVTQYYNIYLFIAVR